MEEVVKECLVSALGLNEQEAQQVTRETMAVELKKWTSLAQLTLVTELEERFGLEFSDEEILELTSVNAIVRTIGDKQGPLQRPPVSPSR